MIVIIVGGGIAGLAASIGLRRAGHQVKVFEKSSFLREVGAAIHICPNASRILLSWGLDADRARMVTAKRLLVAQGPSLTPLVEMDCASVPQRYAAPWFLAHRVDLHSELRRLASAEDGLGDPVEIVLSAEVVGYDAQGAGVVFANGSTEHAELVIAADGVHTTAIREVIGHAPPAVSTGAAAFRFLIPTEELRRDPEIAPLLEDGLMRVMVVEGVRRFIWYPCANNTLENFVGIHPDESTNGHEKEDWDRAADVDDVLAQYHDFHPSILAIIRKATSIKRWPLLYRDPIPTWSRGRLLLIGDAAHPMLPHQGQGGAQAIEDAGALSEIFTALPDVSGGDEIRRRLEVFEKVRVNRASRMQVFSNAGQDEAWKIREAARQYMPEGMEVPTSSPEFMEHNFGYDVVGESRRELGVYLDGRKKHQ
ncbi:putative salicylate hydroxylase [Aspergillus clavatus NRRL 1]|uniref:Salicylate hydroxylase, putative n=1 Tax=Aspergillus clavatus (strain ATCC 1007 / CBS 513.65 / DSM 816 / NCTC 3887 / NRRL 1 / QM 1276 / 107) TaxID=344612 RepID=A1CCQ8_ASPCL|nr:salicylate hydroxylase, putative [Aspergillus clavatus NRRL 1]EAW12315.1 salicylate hydroxylase, putative [Aspergillus clavatus NRRL 1]